MPKLSFRKVPIGRHAVQLTLKERMLIAKKRRTPVAFKWIAVLVASLTVVLLVASLFQRFDAHKPPVVYDDELLGASDDNLYTAVFVGNMMLGNDVARVGDSYGYDSLFRGAKGFWADSDFVLGNLECALLSEKGTYKKLRDKEEYFSASDDVAEVMADAGFTSLQLANNHTDDYRKKGLRHTIRSVNRANIAVSGAGENMDEAQTAVISSSNNLTVSTLSVSATVPYRAAAGAQSAGISTFRGGSIFEKVRKASEESDIVVVAAHWGEDGSRIVTDDMRRRARELVDAGADIVIGTGTNTVQPIELYRDGVILYDVGNFITDDEFVGKRDGVLARLVVDKFGHMELRAYPLTIKHCVPTFAESGMSAIRSRASLTNELSEGTYRVENGAVVIPLRTIDLESLISLTGASASGSVADGSTLELHQFNEEQGYGATDSLGEELAVDLMGNGSAGIDNSEVEATRSGAEYE